MTAPLRAARVDDLDRLLAFARAFHAEDGHPLNAAGEAAVAALLANPDLGQIYVVEQDGAAVGYAVLCHGFSIEYGGRDTIVDDVYLVPAVRGQGLGTRVMHALMAEARRLGCRAIHLEVLPDNPAAALYRRLGFDDRGSRFMGRLLA